MRIRNVRDTRIALPSDDPDDLPHIDRVPARGDRVTDSVLTGDPWARATVNGTVISHCWLTAADLSATSFNGVTLDRCVLSGCSLTGTDWNNVTLRDVVFEECRLDYGTLAGVTTAGPAVFIRCSFTETAIVDSTLTKTVFERCRLDRLDLQRCDLRGADLCGNDLHDLSTPTSLRGVRLDQEQLPALADALVRELAITVTTDR